MTDDTFNLTKMPLNAKRRIREQKNGEVLHENKSPSCAVLCTTYFIEGNKFELKGQQYGKSNKKLTSLKIKFVMPFSCVIFSFS